MMVRKYMRLEPYKTIRKEFGFRGEIRTDSKFLSAVAFGMLITSCGLGTIGFVLVNIAWLVIITSTIASIFDYTFPIFSYIRTNAVGTSLSIALLGITIIAVGLIFMAITERIDNKIRR